MGGDGNHNTAALQHELSIHERLTAAIVASALPQALATFDEHQAQEVELIQQYYDSQ